MKRRYSIRFARPVYVDGIMVEAVGPFDTSAQAADWMLEYELENGRKLPPVREMEVLAR